MSELRRITSAPPSTRAWIAELFAFAGVLGVLARKDFQTRYKRASFGMLWAVALPLFQASVIAVVFSRLVRFETAGIGFGAYVMSGMLPWAYFAGTLVLATTAIVDGASLTDKVWFPRATLPIVPALANIVGFAVSMGALVLLTPLLDGKVGVRMLLIVPGSLLLVGFTMSLGLVLAALYVYFRDVKFLVQAAMLAWLYVTPIIYPRDQIGSIHAWLDVNPMTGVVAFFHNAVGLEGEALLRPGLSSAAVTLVLLVVAVQAYRRHDRLFVDQL